MWVWFWNLQLQSWVKLRKTDRQGRVGGVLTEVMDTTSQMEEMCAMKKLNMKEPEPEPC